jgi:hypothetical protein
MEPGTARVTRDTDSDRCSRALAAGWRGWAGMFILAAAAGLALASGAATGPPAARAAVAVQSHPAFEPCPCDHPVCRPLCLGSVAPGGPAPMIRQHTLLTAARAVDPVTAVAVNCPPPSAPAPASQDGQPGC